MDEGFVVSPVGVVDVDAYSMAIVAIKFVFPKNLAENRTIERDKKIEEKWKEKKHRSKMIRRKS